MVVQNALRTRESDPFKNILKLEAAVDVKNYLYQWKLLNLLHACALRSELPSTIRTV